MRYTQSLLLAMILGCCICMPCKEVDGIWKFAYKNNWYSCTSMCNCKQQDRCNGTYIKGCTSCCIDYREDVENVAEEKVRQQREEKAKKQREENARQQSEENARQQRVEKARKQLEEDARKQLEEDSRKQREEDARHQSEEKARQQREEDARQKSKGKARQQRKEDAEETKSKSEIARNVTFGVFCVIVLLIFIVSNQNRIAWFFHKCVRRNGHTEDTSNNEVVSLSNIDHQNTTTTSCEDIHQESNINSFKESDYL